VIKCYGTLNQIMKEFGTNNLEEIFIAVIDDK